MEIEWLNIKQSYVVKLKWTKSSVLYIPSADRNENQKSPTQFSFESNNNEVTVPAKTSKFKNNL